MIVDFVRFKASDGVELQGWLSNTNSKTAVIHIHGMSGNGYENVFLDYLREMYAKNNLSLFAIDTRGRGVSSSFKKGDDWKQGGSCFEIFEESVHDIYGALDYLRALGKTKFILQGHSLGCTKVVNFLVTQNPADIVKVVLLAPTDMVGWAASHPEHAKYLAKAKKLIALGKGDDLVDFKCWVDETPISAKTYPTICEAGSSADIYCTRTGGVLLGRITIPMVIPYGTEDIGITKIDGSMEKWLERVNKFKNPNTKISVIPGSSHSFRGYEKGLVAVIENFLRVGS